MSDFTRGLSFGLKHGIMQNMFGCGYFSPMRFNCFCNLTPRFFTPILNFNNFNRYYTPSANVQLPCFNIGNGATPYFNYLG